MDPEKRGAIFIFFAAVLFSFGGLFIKLIDWHALSINAARSVLAVAVIGIFLTIKKHKIRFNRYILIGALLMSATTSLYVGANKLTTAANTIVLQYTSPMFIILYMWIFLKEKPKRLDAISCVLVVGGVFGFFIDSLQTGGMLGNAMAIASGATFAGIFMLNKFPKADPVSAVIIGQMINAVVGMPFLATETDFSMRHLALVAGLGIFQLGLAYVFFTTGLLTVPPVTASLITGIEPILNPVLAALFYGERLGPMALISGVLVFLTIITYNVLRSIKPTAVKPHIRAP